MSDIHTYLELLTALDENPLRFAEGEAIFRAGDRADGCMYVVRTGTVVLRSGRRVLERVEPGGMLGEMALIDPAPRSATAIAGPGCTVSTVTSPLFHKLVTSVPGLALEMMRTLARRLRQMTVVPAPPAGRPRRPSSRAGRGGVTGRKPKGASTSRVRGRRARPR